MFEKTVISILKSMSAVIYIVIMLVLFSSPAIFIYQAFRPPVFSFDTVAVPTDLKEDEYLSSIGESPEDWQRIDYKMTASAGEFSPYNYKIDEFIIEENEILDEAEAYKVILDEPLEFSNEEADSFTLSLYIKSEENIDLEELTKSAEFKAKSYEKGFSEFSVKY